MRGKLITYVDLLFAGAPNSTEIHQEILQNTLDRYDDLIGEGKSPEAAYRLAISGIGDINEILSTQHQLTPEAPAKADDGDTLLKQLLRAGAIFLYIISIIPLLILSEIDHIFGTNLGDMSVIGFCATIGICAVATVLLILGRKKKPSKNREEHTEEYDEQQEAVTPESELKKSVRSLISTLGVVAYFIVSFATGAWHITWVIFPLMGAVSGLVTACIDLKEAKKNEK